MMYYSYMSNLNLKFSPVIWLLNDKGTAVFLGAGVGSCLGFNLCFFVGSRGSQPRVPAALDSMGNAHAVRPSGGWPRGDQSVFPP